MLRWLLFIFALLIAALSSLTLVKAFNIPTWMAGILVGEFGHWLILLILVLITVVLAAVPVGFIRQFTLTIYVLAGLVLAKPTVQAWMIAQSLPAKLGRA